MGVEWMVYGKSNEHGSGTQILGNLHIFKEKSIFGAGDSGSSMTAMAATVEVEGLVSSIVERKIHRSSIVWHVYFSMVSMFFWFPIVFHGFHSFSMVFHIVCSWGSHVCLWFSIVFHGLPMFFFMGPMCFHGFP